MSYAFDDFWPLVSALRDPVSDRAPIVRYLCALIAELAYHHVPQFEIDDYHRRATIVPSDAYQIIVRRGTGTNVIELASKLDLPNVFVVVDRGVVAVGVILNEMLFIGFRGTKFLFDWRTNLDASMTPVVSGVFRGPMRSSFSTARVHRGFAEEAVRICGRITDVLRERNVTVKRMFLTGHSLGGAVAALSERFLSFGGTSTIIIASPRYCDIASYYSSLTGPPTQISRPGDIVPQVPPRTFGYADHPYEFDTAGNQVFDRNARTSRYMMWMLLLFISKRFEPHSMEAYRAELGSTAGVASAVLPFSA